MAIPAMIQPNSAMETLTKGQQAMLAVSTAKPSKRVAQELGISPDTVQTRINTTVAALKQANLIQLQGLQEREGERSDRYRDRVDEEFVKLQAATTKLLSRYLSAEDDEEALRLWEMYLKGVDRIAALDNRLTHWTDRILRLWGIETPHNDKSGIVLLRRLYSLLEEFRESYLTTLSLVDLPEEARGALLDTFAGGCQRVFEGLLQHGTE